MNNQKQNNNSKLDDLTVANDQHEAETVRFDDLPMADQQEEQVKGGGGHVKVFDGRTGAEINSNDNTKPGAKFNHNESVVSDEDEDEATTEKLTDLPVTEEQAEETKGGLIGMLLPAVQKVR